MTSDAGKGLRRLGLDEAIRLRWVLRDIKGNRLKWSPPSPTDIRTLIQMGYVEMRNDEPVLTAAGTAEMDMGD